MQPCMLSLTEARVSRETVNADWLLDVIPISDLVAEVGVASQVRDHHLSHWTLLTRANNCLIPSQSYARSMLTISRKNVFQNVTASVTPSRHLLDLHYFADFSYTELPLSFPSHFFPGYPESPSQKTGSILLIVFCTFLAMLPSF